MRKKNLLLTAAFATCANLMYAQNSVTNNGITFTVTSTEMTESGNIANSIDNEKNIYTTSHGVSVTIKKIQEITGQQRNLYVKATSIDASKARVGQIVSWTGTTPQPTNNVNIQYQTSINDFGTDPDQNGTYAYEINTDAPAYKIYADACQKAIENKLPIVKGDVIPTGVWDTQDYDISPDLYYIKETKADRRNGTISTTYEVITRTGGVYVDAIKYIDCTDTYIPTAIDASITYSVSEGKVGTVTGVVNNARIETITAGNSLNYDFSNTIILGEIDQDIPVNKLAYFAKGIIASGQNIVIGSTCENYKIADNGQEIYVSKNFSAEESSYTRSFAADTYGSIVLPFNVSNTSDIFVKQAELTEYYPEDNKLVFSKSPMITPNTPYMFKATSTGGEVLYGDVNTPVYATGSAKSANINGAQFVGTFETVSASEIANHYVIGAGGKIGKTSKALKPGRCYLTRDDSNAAKLTEARIEIIDEDGTIEVVDTDAEVTAIDGVINGNVASIKYIAVDGQISNEPVKGINIVKKTFEDGSVETSKVVY